MDTYMKLTRKGVPVLAVRFEDLTTASEQVIKTVLEYCGAHVTGLTKVNDVLTKDSQAGTVLSQANIRQRQVDLT
jgi:signal-transduction protein with cAMP-binding, CBS, and nucleotidyltransferase domain